MNGCEITGCARRVDRGGLCAMHYFRIKKTGDAGAVSGSFDLATRVGAFWSKVEKTGSNGCWLWSGSTDRHGYGDMAIMGRKHKVHRLAYELLVGPIPAGMQLDHLCRVRHCVNPGHLEPVTLVENVMRGEGFAPQNAAKEHCPQNHPYDEANTYTNPNTGYRLCRQCKRDRRAGTFPNPVPMPRDDESEAA